MSLFGYSNSEDKEGRQHDFGEIGADKLALISLKIEDFVLVMLDEVERSGFTNVEFLVHSQLFLRSITPSYQQEDFLMLLRVLNDTDPEIINSAFYFSLISLRKLCADGSGVQEVFKVAGLSQPLANNKSLTSLAMFSTHFIENIIQQITLLRADKASRNKTIAEYKFEISKCVHKSLSKTLAEVVSANLMDQ